MKARRRKAFMLGPGAASPAELEQDYHFAGLSPAKWLAVFIATGIGLHNFSEGLAIGQSAASDEISLAIVLVIGFALHNATEGFGICAPLSGDTELPSWGFLGLMGLIGGGPTFVGTAVGQAWVSEALSVAVPRARGRLDPLRRDRAAERPPRRGLEDDGDVGDPARARARLRYRLHPRRDGRLIAGHASRAEQLVGSPLFASLTDEQLRAVASLMDIVTQPAGTTLVGEGAPGFSVFVLLDGTADATAEDLPLSTLRAGDYLRRDRAAQRGAPDGDGDGDVAGDARRHVRQRLQSLRADFPNAAQQMKDTTARRLERSGSPE